MRKITIETIAEMLNLSKSTVSRAFCNSFDINPETRRKVLELAEQLNYEPNSVAQSLRKNQTRRIGVIIPSFTIPFYATALGGMQEVVSEEGYSLLICQSNESYESELECIKVLKNSRVDGIIMSVAQDTKDYSHIERMRDNQYPLVLFNRTTPVTGISKVEVDEHESCYKMTEYLLQLGYKKITYLAGPRNLEMVQKRISGFKDAVFESDVNFENFAVFHGDFSIDSGYQVAKKILAKSRPDAIFCVCDNVAFGVIKYLKEQGIRIPQDIAVAGYTDEPIAALFQPSLTTVRQPITQIGRTAVELLLKQFKYTNATPEVRILSTELVKRDSA